MRTAALVLSLVTAFGAVVPVSPPGMAPSGPYTPGILTDDFLYVSGQGAKDAAGQIPAGREDQLRNALDNVRTVVQAAGLTMDHVVYVQVFLTADPDEGPLDAVFRKFFPQAPPARSTIGVAGLPGTPVEISAVAVRDRSSKKIVVPPATRLRRCLAPGSSPRTVFIFRACRELIPRPGRSRLARTTKCDSRFRRWSE